VSWTPELRRPRGDHTCVLSNRVVCTHHGNPQEGNRRHLHVRRSFTPQPIRKTRAIPIRYTHPDITPENAQIFTKLDVRKGYHQCHLDNESQDLTTFITPFGRFEFLRAPYEISSTSEHYNRRTVGWTRHSQASQASDASSTMWWDTIKTAHNLASMSGNFCSGVPRDASPSTCRNGSLCKQQWILLGSSSPREGIKSTRP
jgi:hypothetical protein